MLLTQELINAVEDAMESDTFTDDERELVLNILTNYKDIEDSITNSDF